MLRSRQLSNRSLENAFEKFGIRSVLNLRGHGRGRTWYAEEQAVCQKAEVALTTVTFDVDECPARRASLRFLKAIETLEMPILMHCHRGVDRTGWASAVVVLSNGGGLEEAEAQLSPIFGHVCLKSRCPQHKFFSAYRRWLEDNEQAQSAEVFRRWIEDYYCPDPWNAQLSIVGDVPTTAQGGSSIELTVEAINRGNEPWLMGPSGVRVGIRVSGPIETIPVETVAPFLDRGTITSDLGRGESSNTRIDAGQSEVFRVKVNMPKMAGLYLVQVDMVREHVHWFSEMGWPGLVWPLEIVDG